MNIADRIQNLRKARGISQEELADHIGISRQAVSKWESEQSLPDIDRIIALSDYFGVTTDYLLKGIEAAPDRTGWTPNALLFTAGGTAVNAIGLISAILIWVELQTAWSVGAGLIAMLTGTFLFLVGQIMNAQEKERARLTFLLGNVWILSFIPASCLFNLVKALLSKGGWLLSPIPEPTTNYLVFYLLFWVAYFGGCAAVDVILLQKRKQGRTSP